MKLSIDSAAKPAKLAPPGARLLSNCRLTSRLAGLLSVCVGLMVLVGGWGFDISLLRVLVPGYTAMMQNTALGILLFGAAVWFNQADQTRGAKRLFVHVCAGIAGLIGVMTLIEYFLGMNLGIDGLIFHNSVRLATPGRMAVMSAVTL